MPHTKTLWSAEIIPSNKNFAGWSIIDAEYNVICDLYAMVGGRVLHFDNAEANAHHIVKCFNMHDELVEVIKEFVELSEVYDEIFNDYELEERTQFRELFQKAHRALDKTKGE